MILLLALFILPPIYLWRYPEKSFNILQKTISGYRTGIKGELIVDDKGKWKQNIPGIAVRKIKIHRGKEKLGVSLRLVRIDPKYFDFKVVTVPLDEITNTSIYKVAESLGATGIINGSFFNSQLGILGLAISDGVETSRMTVAGENRAMFYVKNSIPDLVHRDGFSKAGISQALQAGPWLVVDSSAKKRFKHPGRIDRRSAVCISKKGEIVFVITDTAINGITLPHLAEILAKKEPDGPGCIKGVNLDGGASSQLLLMTDKTRLMVRGFVNVPVYIAAIPKVNDK